MSHRPAALAAALLAALFLGSGCSGGVHSLSFDPPSGTAVSAPPTLSTLPPGLAALSEAPAPGVTTTVPPQIGPGSASLNGTVTGPSGPVGGATVQIDRYTPSGFASARAKTAADGTWSFRNILGGSFRIRAWLAPTLDMQAPQTLFLSANQPGSVSLQLTSYTGQQVQAAINPSVPIIDQPVNLVVQVTTPTVDTNGVLTSPPVVGASVTLVNGPGWQVQNGNPLTTGPNGEVQFQVQCINLGSDPLGAQVSTNPPVALQIPDCSNPPPTTTTTTTNPFATTTTTCPPPGTGHGRPTTTTIGFGSC